MYICGLDEVGRGALAGPLVAVAALFEWEWAELETAKSPIKGVNDSKKLSPHRRQETFQRILRSEQLLDFGIGEVSANEINHRGIEWANSIAFERAVKDLRYGPHMILIDGDKPLFGWEMARQHHEPRADGKWWPVGAASIIAKVIRDTYMTELGKDFPCYHWERNSGYGSEDHRTALVEHGVCHLHRSKFVRNIIRSPHAADSFM